MAYQTRDVVEAMSAASGTTLAALRVDGGASVMNVLLQMQADQLGVTVQRRSDKETTRSAPRSSPAWPKACGRRCRDRRRVEIDATFQPSSDRMFADLAYAEWTRAVERSRGWVGLTVSRGAIVVAASVTALLLATAVAAAADEIGAAIAGAPATRSTAVQATPTMPPPVPRVLWVGDSSLEGLKFYSTSQRAIAGMTYVLDAESCRRLIRPSCHSLAGNTPNTALEAIQGAPGAFDAVIVGTGYNEGSSQFSSDFDQIVAAARAKGAVRILWMNYRLRDGLTRAGTDNNGSYVSNNATLLRKVASGAYPDVFIANWRDYSAPVRDWFVSDGIHYMPTGALGAADYLSRWITALFDEPCPQPMVAGGPIANPCTPPDGSPPPTSTPSTADHRPNLGGVLPTHLGTPRHSTPRDRSASDPPGCPETLHTARPECFRPTRVPRNTPHRPAWRIGEKVGEISRAWGGRASGCGCLGRCAARSR